MESSHWILLFAENLGCKSTLDRLWQFFTLLHNAARDVAGCNRLYSLWLREVVVGCIVQRQENSHLTRIL